MSVTVLAAIVCAVLAAVGTGVLVGRSIRVPRMDIPAWACTLAGLAVALGAQAYGTYRGYGSGTFRAVQFGAQLIAPLWLAWGLAELTAKSVSVRFGAKLVTMALTVVTGVVLVTDPLSSTPFSKSWPAAPAHYQIIPRSLLSLIAGVTLAAVVIALIFAVVRLRTDPAWRNAAIPIVAAGIGAVLVLGLRLTLPNAAYLALCAGCAALTWFAGGWADRIGLAELHGEVPPARAARRDRRVAASLAESGDDESFGAGYEPEARDGGHRRFGDRYGDDDWYRPVSGDQATSRYPPSGGYQRNGGITMNGLYQGERGYEPDEADRSGVWRPRTIGGDAGLGGGSAGFGGDAGLGGGDDGLRGAGLGAGSAGLGGGDNGLGDNGLGDNGLGDNGLGDNGLGGAGPGAVNAGLGGGHAGPGFDDNGFGGAGLGAGAAHVPAAAPTGPEPVADPAMDQAATQRLYGLIAIYTLAEGAADEFDALAERVVEEVRSGEPEALVYAVHSVPNAPMQRIFYEVYRDRMAYEDHQRQPHILRFESDRSPHVLATNVIELGMQQAKLSPPPGLSPMFGHSPGA